MQTCKLNGEVVMNQKEWKTSGKFPGKYEWYNKTRRLQRSLCYEPDPNASIIHHLRDTEEQRKYNDEHYEYWGFNEDGTFEYGKYVVFWTKEKHDQYHHCSEETKRKDSESVKASMTLEVRSKISASLTGEKNPMYGKRGELATCYGRCGELHPMYGKVGPNKGRTFDEDVRDRMSAGSKKARQFTVMQWNHYKTTQGDISWYDFNKRLSKYMKTLDKHDKYNLFTFDKFIQFIHDTYA